MKATGSNLTRWVTGLALGLAISGATFAATGIANTKHNLGSGGTSSQISGTATTDQICVFCHTPHGSDTSAAVPLWNKSLPTGTYNVYNSTSTSATSTIDGEILTAVGSVSIACLSCHDGTQAMDNMINRPGSGLYNAAGVNLWGVGNVTKMTGTVTTPLGAGLNIPVIGTDLRNDHPIGIAYCGGGLTGSGTTVSGSCNDADFVSGTGVATTHFPNAKVNTKDSNGTPVFWVETGVANLTTRQKTDIALYTRDFAGAPNTPSVECGSCHDPHVESKGTDNIMFMRVTTAGSAICLSCHVK